jgi:hypothetical protein
VLEGVKGEVGEVRGLRVVIDPHHPAFVVELVESHCHL